MKIIYSLEKKLVENDKNSFSTYPLSKYSKLEIFHGLAFSNIVLIFDYWGHKILTLEGGLLAFISNTKSGINDIKSGDKEVAHVFSLEQGYSLKLRLKNEILIINGFNNEYSVELKNFELALYNMSINAFDELSILYPGLEENNYFVECKNSQGVR